MSATQWAEQFIGQIQQQARAKLTAELVQARLADLLAAGWAPSVAERQAVADVARDLAAYGAWRAQQQS